MLLLFKSEINYIIIFILIVKYYIYINIQKLKVDICNSKR